MIGERQIVKPARHEPVIGAETQTAQSWSHWLPCIDKGFGSFRSSGSQWVLQIDLLSGSVSSHMPGHIIICVQINGYDSRKQ
jgi:hypothetical protein